MSEFDCWFLELAVESPVSFQVIMPYDQCIVPDDYQTPSDLTTDQIVDILFCLFKDNFLLAITSADLYSLETSLINELSTKALIPSREQIKAALERNNSREGKLHKEFDKEELYFFLTEKGGKQWESFFKPEWHQYFRRCILNWESVSEEFRNNSILPNGNVICCADKEIGKRIIATEHILNRNQFIVYPIEESIIWETFTPWHPTYWKTLPYGYAVSYQAKLVEVDKNAENTTDPKELTEEAQKAEEWYMNTVNWYISR